MGKLDVPARIVDAAFGVACSTSRNLFLLSVQRFANWGRGSGAGKDLANSLGGETDGDTVGAVGDADGA